MIMIAALVIGFYVMLAIGISIPIISQWRRERKAMKDPKILL
jgi:hypothetical protein